MGTVYSCICLENDEKVEFHNKDSSKHHAERYSILLNDISKTVDNGHGHQYQPIDPLNYRRASELKPLKRNVSFMEPLFIVDTYSKNEEKLIQDSIDNFTDNFICINLLEEINDQLEYEEIDDCIEYTIINRSNGIDPIEYVDKEYVDVHMGTSYQQSQNLLHEEFSDDPIINAYTAVTTPEKIVVEVTRTTRNDSSSNQQDLQQQILPIVDERSHKNSNTNSILINVKITDDDESSYHSLNSNYAIEKTPHVMCVLPDIDYYPLELNGGATTTSMSFTTTMNTVIKSATSENPFPHPSPEVPTAIVDGTNFSTFYTSQPLGIQNVAELSHMISPSTTITTTIGASDVSVISVENQKAFPLSVTTPSPENHMGNIDTRIAQSTDSATTTTSYNIHETWMESALSLSPSPSHSPTPSSPLVYESLSDLLLHRVSSQYSIDENETNTIELTTPPQHGALNPSSTSRSDSDPPVILKPVTPASTSRSNREFKMNERLVTNTINTNTVNPNNHIRNSYTNDCSSSDCSTLTTILNRRNIYNSNTSTFPDIHDLWAKVEQDLYNLRKKQIDMEVDSSHNEEGISIVTNTDMSTTLSVLPKEEHQEEELEEEEEEEEEEDATIISITDRENGDRSSIDFEDVQSVSSNKLENTSQSNSIGYQLMKDSLTGATSCSHSVGTMHNDNNNNIESNECKEIQILFDKTSPTVSDNIVMVNDDDIRTTHSVMHLEEGYHIKNSKLENLTMSRDSLSNTNGETTSSNDITTSTKIADPDDIPLKPIVTNIPLSLISSTSATLMQLSPPDSNLKLSLDDDANANDIAVQEKSVDVTTDVTTIDKATAASCSSHEILDSLLVPFDSSDKAIDSVVTSQLSQQPLVSTPLQDVEEHHQESLSRREASASALSLASASIPLPTSNFTSSSHKSRRTMSASLSTLDILDIDTYSNRFSRSLSGLLSTLSFSSSSSSPAQSVALETMSSTSQTLPVPLHPPPLQHQHHHHHRYKSTDSYFEGEQGSLSASALSELYSHSQTQSPVTTGHHHTTSNAIHSPMYSVGGGETEDQFDVDAIPTSNYLIHSRYSSESLAIPRFISRTVTPEGSGGMISRRTSRTFTTMSDNTEHDIDVDAPHGVSTSSSDASSNTSRNNSHDDIRQLIIKSLQNPSVLVGWEVYVENLGVGQVLSHSKAMFFATKFEIEFENGKTMLVSLKRSQHKSGSNFTPLRKLF